MKTRNPDLIIDNLLKFLNSSPTAWHAVANCKKELLSHDFQELKEDQSWKLTPGGNYFVCRNGSSLCAFTLPKKNPESLRLIATHTDSPAFKLKPNAEFYKENMLMLGLEIYGAPILASWLNRDLAIAGKVVFLDKKNQLKEDLVNLTENRVVIPQLAIHLDRNVNESGPLLNKQEHLAALAGLGSPKKNAKRYLERVLKKNLPIKELLSYDLFLAPIEKACLIGENRELISSYRIDNLSSTYAALSAMLNTNKPLGSTIKMIVFWDNEEIGSHTSQGASSPFLPQVIERICLALKLHREEFFKLLSRSLCASVDLTHALHPNYSDKHEPRHTMLLNQGVAIKTNAQYRYASDALSSASIINLCKKHFIPFQKYASRGDIPSGSTVGPIHANLTGMATVDIGCPQLSMHSCREIMGIQDQISLCRLLEVYLETQLVP